MFHVIAIFVVFKLPSKKKLQDRVHSIYLKVRGGGGGGGERGKSALLLSIEGTPRVSTAFLNVQKAYARKYIFRRRWENLR